jgi:hypothetical protein
MRGSTTTAVEHESAVFEDNWQLPDAACKTSWQISIPSLIEAILPTPSSPYPARSGAKPLHDISG